VDIVSKVLRSAAPIPALSAALFLAPAIAQDAESVQASSKPPLTSEIITRSIGRPTTEEEEENLADRAHLYLGTKADDLVIYLDKFFGAPLQDLESADSTVRLTTRFDYDEDDGWETNLRARGTYHLPRINNRLSLVFNAEDEDYRTTYEPDEERNVAGFQFLAFEKTHSRFDLTLGVSSGLNLRPGVRYRFKKSFNDWDRYRYTGRVENSHDRRTHMINQFDADYATSDTSVIRFVGRTYNGEVSEGTEWAALSVWRKGFHEGSAIMAGIGAVGKTDPNVPEDLEGIVDPALNGGSLVTNQGGWVLYRRRLYKDWLFVQFSPGYTWRKEHHFEDRHGVFFARLDFEITLNRGREDERISDQEITSRLGTGSRLPL
jgi:hypothetical protein